MLQGVHLFLSWDLGPILCCAILHLDSRSRFEQSGHCYETKAPLRMMPRQRSMCVMPGFRGVFIYFAITSCLPVFIIYLAIAACLSTAQNMESHKHNSS